MSRLDLSPPSCRTWRLFLPPDFRQVLPDDAVVVPDEVQSLFDGHLSADAVMRPLLATGYVFGRLQGAMVLCWLSDSAASLAPAMGDPSLAATMEAILKSAIAPRLARGAMVRNAELMRDLARGALPEPAARAPSITPGSSGGLP